jgi:hypothetical protein
MLISPPYGDTYSFPWKRGPHDNLGEYLETFTRYTEIRKIVFQSFKEFDFLKVLTAVYNSEEDGKGVVVSKVACLRVIIQLLRQPK